MKLIENNSTSYGVKRSAAKQAKLMINDDNRDIILQDCLYLLWNKSSDIRQVTSTIFENISIEKRNAKNENKDNDESKDFNENKDKIQESIDNLITIDELENIIRIHPPLMASKGSEYNISTTIDAKQQKQSFKKALGLMDGMGDDFANDLVEDDDFISSTTLKDKIGESPISSSSPSPSTISSSSLSLSSQTGNVNQSSPSSTASLLKSTEGGVLLGERKLSAKERLLQKRLSKKGSTLSSSTFTPILSSTLSSNIINSASISIEMNKNGIDEKSSLINQNSISSKSLSHSSTLSSLILHHKRRDGFEGGIEDKGEEYHLPLWLEELRENMFNPDWNYRHGSLLALRSLSLSLSISLPFLSRDLIIVLFLDKFSDFIGDQCHAPIRELAAQCLGKFHGIKGLVNLLIATLAKFEHSWQIKHAALLALKALAKNNKNVIDSSFSSLVFTKNLKDPDDDIKCISAEILLAISAPITLEIIKDCLENISDDTSPSFLLSLLNIISQGGYLKSNEMEIISHLWHLSRHPSFQIKNLIIQIFKDFITIPQNVKLAIRILLQIQLLDEEIRGDGLKEIIQNLFNNLKLMDKQKITIEIINDILDSALTPLDHPFDGKKFLFPSFSSKKISFSSIPSEYEIGFRKADLITIDRMDALRGRILVAQSLGYILYASKINQQSEWLIQKMTLLSNSPSLSSPSSPSVSFYHENSVLGRLIFMIIADEAHLSNLPWKEIVNFYEFKEFEQSIAEIGMAIKKKIDCESTLKNILDSSSNSNSSSNLNSPSLSDSNKRALEELNKTINLWKIRIDSLKNDSNALLESLQLEPILPLKKRAAIKLEPNMENLKILHDGKHYSSLEMIIKEHSDSMDLFHLSHSNWDNLIIRYAREEFFNLHLEEYWIKKSPLSISDIIKKRSLLMDRFIMEIKDEINSISNSNPNSNSTSNSNPTSSSLLLSHVQSIRNVIENCEDQVIPYAPILLGIIIPILGRQNEKLRRIATFTFSSLVRLVSLESPLPSGSILQDSLSESLLFASQLLEGERGKVNKFVIPCHINATLRPYQQDGVNWLAFLRKFGLHGILADDMGLGKTLQTLSILSSEHYEHANSHSLVVCPASLVGHWESEILKYFPMFSCSHAPSSLTSFNNYIGSNDSSKLEKQQQKEEKEKDDKVERVFIFSGSNRKNRLLKIRPSVIIVSYDILRCDIDFLMSYCPEYSYCILDEGHLVRNTETKLYSSIKLIKARYRLILTGTPIQNHVSELWALFDWLMPGFLGNSESDFMMKYGKFIEALQPKALHSSSMNSIGASGTGSTISSGGSAGNSSSTSNQITNEKEWNKIESKLMDLHKQILPFLLRRMKDTVLKDLPPKIIQDWMCEPSPLQRALFDKLERGLSLMDEIDDQDQIESNKIDNKSKRKGMENENLNEKREGAGDQHIFKILHLLRNICMDPKSIKGVNNLIESKDSKRDITDNEEFDGINNDLPPKLQALRDLLLENANDGDHKFLIFAQSRKTLDLIENKLLLRKPISNSTFNSSSFSLFNSLKYLRLDGSVPSTQRFSIANSFNNDPSITLMLLTTSVGGLGLTLTGADVVIFLEHDWNPQKDLQAMDRAHRLGQTKTVMVYRLIIKDSIEERIMGLQKWKQKVAGTIIEQQSTDGIERKDILELLSANAIEQEEKEEKRNNIKSKMEKDGKIKDFYEKNIKEDEWEDADNQKDLYELVKKIKCT